MRCNKFKHTHTHTRLFEGRFADDLSQVQRRLLSWRPTQTLTSWNLDSPNVYVQVTVRSLWPKSFHLLQTSLVQHSCTNWNSKRERLSWLKQKFSVSLPWVNPKIHRYVLFVAISYLCCQLSGASAFLQFEGKCLPECDVMYLSVYQRRCQLFLNYMASIPLDRYLRNYPMRTLKWHVVPFV